MLKLFLFLSVVLFVTAEVTITPSKLAVELGETFSVRVQNTEWDGIDYVIMYDVAANCSEEHYHQPNHSVCIGELAKQLVRGPDVTVSFVAPALPYVVRIVYYNWLDIFQGHSEDITVFTEISLQTRKEVYEIGEEIQLDIVTSPWHSGDDYIEVYYYDYNFDAIWYWDTIDVPEGESHSTITVEGIPQKSFVTFEYYYYNGKLAVVYNNTRVESIAELWLQAPESRGSKYVPIGFKTSKMDITNDWIGLYDVDSECVTIECYISYAWVPPDTQVGLVSLRLPLESGDYHLEARYYTNLAQMVARVDFYFTVLGTEGTCAEGCSNAGSVCTSAADCTNCNEETEVLCEREFYISAEAERESLRVAVGTQTNLRFNFVGTEAMGTISGFCTGVPAGAVSTVNQFANELSINIQWQPNELQISQGFDICCTGHSDGIDSDKACTHVHVVGSSCVSYGDPHITLFDGANLNFQAEGDFYLVKSNAYSIQARFQRCSPQSLGTCNRAIAFGKQAASIAVYFSKDNLRVEINRQTITFDRELTAAAGIRITKYVDAEFGTGYGLMIEMNSRVRIQVSGLNTDYPGITVTLPGSNTGRVDGLCGNFNFNATDDFVDGNGNLIPADDEEAIYNQFGLRYRVPIADSLFTYPASGPNSYGSINNLNWNPYFSPSFNNQNFEQLANAVCANLTSNPVTFRSCVFDVSMTGNFDVAASAFMHSIQLCRESSINTPSCAVNTECTNFCSLNGICDNSQCICNPGWTGDDCSIRTSPPDTSSGTSSSTTGTSDEDQGTTGQSSSSGQVATTGLQSSSTTGIQGSTTGASGGNQGTTGLTVTTGPGSSTTLGTSDDDDGDQVEDDSTEGGFLSNINLDFNDTTTIIIGAVAVAVVLVFIISLTTFCRRRRSRGDDYYL